MNVSCPLNILKRVLKRPPAAATDDRNLQRNDMIAVSMNSSGRTFSYCQESSRLIGNVGRFWRVSLSITPYNDTPLDLGWQFRWRNTSTVIFTPDSQFNIFLI